MTISASEKVKAHTRVSASKHRAGRMRALVQLMRHSGLSINDAVTLPRQEIIRDAQKNLWRVVTARQKTGTDVSVPLPLDVAQEVLAAFSANSNPRYAFWTGKGEERTAVSHWQDDFRKLFKDAGLYDEAEGKMVSHRLRDSFAVDLLEKGAPLEEVSKLLGHESLKTTEKHLRLRRQLPQPYSAVMLQQRQLKELRGVVNDAHRIHAVTKSLENRPS